MDRSAWTVGSFLFVGGKRSKYHEGPASNQRRFARKPALKAKRDVRKHVRKHVRIYPAGDTLSRMHTHPKKTRQSPRTRTHITLRKHKKQLERTFFGTSQWGSQSSQLRKLCFSACKAVLCMLHLLLQSYGFQSGAGHLRFAR